MKARFLLLLALLAPNVLAHELQDNRATLVLRDGTYLTLTLFINYTQALHLALAPQRPFQEFLLVFSAMTPEELQPELLRAQARFEASTRLEASPGKELALTRWSWPDANQVLNLLRLQVMRAIADPSDHAHEAPVEIRADANARQKISTVRIQFPEELQKVLVVSYRPSQVRVNAKSLSPAIKF